MSDYHQNVMDGFVDDIFAVIEKYEDTMTLATVIGCLEIIKHELIVENSGDDDE